LYLVILDGAVIRALVTAGVADLFDIYTTTEAARRARVLGQTPAAPWRPSGRGPERAAA
jgi:hypothetical protein